MDPSQGMDMIGDLIIAEGCIASIGHNRDAMSSEPYQWSAPGSSIFTAI